MTTRSRWGLLLVVLAGCDRLDLDVYRCLEPDRGHKGPDGQPDPCHRQDASSGGTGGGPAQCAGGEFSHWSVQWASPMLLWIGPEDQAPECPRGPNTVAYEGHADLVAPSTCEVCTCEPPTGSCALPSTLTASASPCSMPGGFATSFNAPTPWDGSCDSTTQTPNGAAHSLTIDPIAMTEDGCASGPPVAAKFVSPRWETLARGCDIDLPKGPVDRSICPAEVPRVPGFAVCLFRDGEFDCPDAPGNLFTERHVFYQAVQDDRQCSACTCGAPTGSACTATIAIYKGNDLTCSGPMLDQITVSSSSPTCIDIQLPGQSLGSKSAGSTTYLPGICPPGGGESSGVASPSEPSTICCVP